MNDLATEATLIGDMPKFMFDAVDITCSSLSNPYNAMGQQSYSY